MLEHLPRDGPAAVNGAIPRAVRIPLPNHLGVTCEIWMGGAHSTAGEMIQATHLHDAWVVDCARDMPEDHRVASALMLYRVFSDSEQTPDSFARIDALAGSLAAAMLGVISDGAWEHPPSPPVRLYVMCSQGLNRSGLVTGRLLRALGLSGEEAVAAIRTARPAALNNLTFLRLVTEDTTLP